MVKERYKQTETGLVPSDWNVCTVESIADVKTGPFGSALHANDYVIDGVPIITVEHLGDSAITQQNLPLVSREDKKRLSAYTLKRGDVVFSRVGSVDRSGYITGKEDGWLYSGRLLRLRIKSDSINPQFLGYYFKHEPTKQRMRNVAVGLTMASLNTKIMNEFVVAFPADSKEQIRIAQALFDMDELISNLEKLIAKKKAVKQGAMQELLTGKRRLPGFTGKLDKVKLGECCRLLSGGTPSKANHEWWNGTIPWISSSDISIDDINSIQISRYISLDAVEHSATKLCPSHSVLIVSRVGVGKVAVNCCELCTSQDFTVLIPQMHEAFYLAYYLLPVMQKKANQTQGTSIKGITIEDIAEIEVLNPEFNEQIAIVEILDDMDSEIEQLEKKLSKYRHIKSGMMSELLTGRTRLL